MSFSSTFLSEMTDPKHREKFSKSYAMLLKELRQLPESAYFDPKIQKLSLEYLDHCKASVTNAEQHRNIVARMSSRLVKLRKIRKAKIMADQLEGTEEDKEEKAPANDEKVPTEEQKKEEGQQEKQEEQKQKDTGPTDTTPAEGGDAATAPSASLPAPSLFAK